MTSNGLPLGWMSTTLGEAFRWGSGGTPRRAKPEYYGGGIPWAIIRDLKDGPIVNTANTITQLGLESSSTRLVPIGSVLLAMYGSIGKLGIAAAQLTTNQAIAFTQTEPTYNKYLFWYLRAFRNDLIALGKGDTQSNISQTVIKGFPFLLAPLPEQHRIVAEIEKQFSRLDASVEALKRAQVNLRRYRSSVLKSACEGKLVPNEAELAQAEGRDFEPADRLLERILIERRDRWESQKKRRGKYKEPVAPDTSNLPELPEGWVWATLGQATEIQGGIQKQPKRAPVANAFPFLRVANVLRGALDLEEVHQIEVFSGELEKLRLLSGDLLIVEGNGSPIADRTDGHLERRNRELRSSESHH